MTLRAAPDPLDVHDGGVQQLELEAAATEERARYFLDLCGGTVHDACEWEEACATK